MTPNAARVVEIAAIDKRSGRTEVFRGNPGQLFTFDRLSIKVKTCETTPPWEERLTGAFLQIDEAAADGVDRGGAGRIFSGWMFAESPSLNPLEHTRYDVWVKSCAMRWPENVPTPTPSPTPAPAPDAAPS